MLQTRLETVQPSQAPSLACHSINCTNGIYAMAYYLWADREKCACEYLEFQTVALFLRDLSSQSRFFFQQTLQTQRSPVQLELFTPSLQLTNTQTYSSTSARNFHFWIRNILLLRWGRIWGFVTYHSPAPGSDCGARPCPSPAVWSAPSAACCGLWSLSELVPGPPRSPPSRLAVRGAAEELHSAQMPTHHRSESVD